MSPQRAGPVGRGPSAADRLGATTRLRALLPGLAAAVLIAAAATAVGRTVPILGAAVPALLIGAVLAPLLRRSSAAAPGVRFASRTVLQVSVVLLGTQLSLADIGTIGAGSLPIMLITLGVCLSGALLLGWWLGVRGNVQTLIGVGTGICGASAIAAVAPVVGAAGAEITYAVSTIFLFNIAAVVTFPWIGHLLGMDQHAFGLFAGTAVNDTSSVVAAAAVYGTAALGFAVVVKLVRTLMIVPIVVGLSVHRVRQQAPTAGAAGARGLTPRRILALVPWFIWGFLAMSGLRSTGALPTSWLPALAVVSAFLITVAMAGIGLSTDLASFRRAGLRPLLLGGLLWVLLSVTSLLVISVLGA